MIIFNIKLIHLTLLSISAARAQSGASIASQAPLEFDSPEAWYAGMDTIERRFAELYPQWLRLEAVTPLRGVQEGMLTSSLEALERQRLDLEDELVLKKARLRDVEVAPTASRRRLELARASESARVEAQARYQADLVEANARLEHAYLEVRTTLAPLTGAEARVARFLAKL